MEFCNGTSWGSIAGEVVNPRVLLSTQTASNSSQIVFTGIDGTYSRYEIELDNVQPANNDVNLYMQVSTNGGVSYHSTAVYQWEVLFARPGLANEAFDSNDNEIQFLRSACLRSDGSQALSGEITLITPASTSKYHSINKYHSIKSSFFHAATDVTMAVTTGGAYFNSTTAYNAVRLYMSGGNISVGTFRLYGLK